MPGVWSSSGSFRDEQLQWNAAIHPMPPCIHPYKKTEAVMHSRCIQHPECHCPPTTLSPSNRQSEIARAKLALRLSCHAPPPDATMSVLDLVNNTRPCQGSMPANSCRRQPRCVERGWAPACLRRCVERG
eukprot:355417-Chlamydomonas_euryale.AAC.1